jgi:DNA-directed RNA polymerase subunit RPC12/RpoP
LKDYNLQLIDENYKHSQFRHNWRCLRCGGEFSQTWNEIQDGGYLCPNCYPRTTGFSLIEKEIINFLKKNININIIENSRHIIPPKEIDIYLPDYNLAIEFNGLYYHSELFNKDKNYNLNKTNECKEKGIRLIHIFEDEWLFKKDIVKNRLMYILNNSKNKKINARDCIIKEVDPKTKNEFLETFHLQGKDTSKIKLGAFYNNELVSVMTFSLGSISKGSKLNPSIWELSRFASNYNYHIPGIASKLLTYFKRNYNWKEIFTFADKRWSEGNLYYKLGFEHLYDNEPSYWYINQLKRIHRFNLRKKEYEPKNITEWKLRYVQGYYRIWDCGNMKFSLTKY